MTKLDSMTVSVEAFEEQAPLDQAQLAAVAYLARYSGRTLDAYRHDLRTFQWAADMGLAVLDATRPHIELYRATLEQRRLAASTIDRRLSTVCGFYRFAHIDGRVASNPAQYVRRPKVYPTEGHGMDRGELGGSCSRRSGSTAPTPRWRYCWASTGCGSARRAPPILRISVWSGDIEPYASSARGTSLRSSRWCLARRGPSIWLSGSAAKGRSCAAATVSALTGARLTVGCAPSASGPDWSRCTPICSGQASSWRRLTPASRFETSRPLLVTPTLEPPRS
jgi:hypothetical protein